MQREKSNNESAGFSRRGFLQTSAAVSAAAVMANLGTNFAHAAGTDRIRVGLVGCGGRGTGAAQDCMKAAENAQVVALGDLFEDKAKDTQKKFNSMGKEGATKDKFNISDDNTFWGWDAYKKVLATDINLIIFATPPGFRPGHIKAAIEAGKNVFAEKPVAVDPTGIRTVIEAAEMAEQKKLAFVTGTQRRHQAPYIETIKRIHDGAIGDVTAGQIYWNQGGLWNHGRKPEWSDVEWQIRNWLYFTWLSGDHITEQHVHNIDVMNWVMGGPPVEAYGMGGRQVRTDPAYGHIFDHFAIEYVFKNGVRWASQCRQIDGTDSRVSEWVVGSKGTSNPGGSIMAGGNKWQYEGPQRNPYEQEHVDLVASIRDGKPLNEGRRIAESTLTAIIGRMSAYTGKIVKFDWAMKQSKLDLMPKDLTFGPMPVAPVAVPGRDPLI
jgi:predicted dehydrogenase